MPEPAALVSHLQRTHTTSGLAIHAVRDASWQAPLGAVTALLGPNGAGKSTTIECLVGLQQPTSGQVKVLGTDPWRASATHRARVGVMLQDGGLAASARPLDLIAHLAGFYGTNDADSLIERLDIASFASRPVRRLSGGQRQRVALAASLVGRPEVVFLDEPSAGLDPHVRRQVWDLIAEQSAAGVGVVVSTHSFEEAERLADHLVIMSGGRVVASGDLDQVRGGHSLEDAYFALTDAELAGQS